MNNVKSKFAFSLLKARPEDKGNTEETIQQDCAELKQKKKKTFFLKKKKKKKKKKKIKKNKKKKKKNSIYENYN